LVEPARRYKKMYERVITANRIRDGVAVYLRRTDAERSWTESIAEASAVGDAESLASLTELASVDAGRAIVIEPYAIDVVVGGTGNEAVTLREKIRAIGPTVDGMGRGIWHVQV
jgi:hypothetical protein